MPWEPLPQVQLQDFRYFGKTKTLIFQNPGDWVAGSNPLFRKNVTNFLGSNYEWFTGHFLSNFNWTFSTIQAYGSYRISYVNAGVGHAGSPMIVTFCIFIFAFIIFRKGLKSRFR
jgi:hypothetical protein